MELKIFNLNCWLLFPPLSIKNRKRLFQIISLIKEYRPHVIALQEVWLQRYITELENNLKQYFFIKTESGFYNKNGLLTGFLQKPREFKINFFPYTKRHNLIEKIAQKGYHLVKLSEDLFLVNVHLCHALSNAEKAVSKLQFDTIQQLMPSQQMIICGDLNLNENELNALNKRFSYDKSYGLTVCSANSLTRAGHNKIKKIRGKLDTKIDYVLGSGENLTSLRTTRLESPIVSDHYALISNIEIKNN